MPSQPASIPPSSPKIERRSCARRPVAAPVKLRCVQTGRYLAGQTLNVSATGALMAVYHPSKLVHGQRLEVGIAWDPNSVVLQADQLFTATVVRSLAIDALQYVALRYDQPVELAASA